MCCARVVSMLFVWCYGVALALFLCCDYVHLALLLWYYDVFSMIFDVLPILPSDRSYLVLAVF